MIFQFLIINDIFYLKVDNILLSIISKGYLPISY
jgi:hypothetical protein